MVPERTDDQGRWKTNNGYRLKIAPADLKLTLGDPALQAPGKSSGGGTGGRLDPANPPTGYTLCHGGHCHRADGTTVPYADVEAEMSAGNMVSPPATVLTLKPTSSELALSPGWAGRIDFSGCTPDCYLPLTTISQVVLPLVSLTASGQVVSATSSAPPRPFTLTIKFSDVALTAKLPVPVVVGATGPGRLAVGGTLILTSKLFDSLPWERLLATPGTDPVDLSADKDGADTMVVNLTQSTFVASVSQRAETEMQASFVR